MLVEDYWELPLPERMKYGMDRYLRDKEMTEWRLLFEYGKIPTRPKYQSKTRWRSYCLKVKGLYDRGLIKLNEDFCNNFE